MQKKKFYHPPIDLNWSKLEASENVSLLVATCLLLTQSYQNCLHKYCILVILCNCICLIVSITSKQQQKERHLSQNISSQTIKWDLSKVRYFTLLVIMYSGLLTQGMWDRVPSLHLDLFTEDVIRKMKLNA